MSCEDSDILSDEIFLNQEIRRRRTWQPDSESLLSVTSRDLDLLDLDDLDEEEEDGVGCPLPSTPEDTELLEQEVSANEPTLI